MMNNRPLTGDPYDPYQMANVQYVAAHQSRHYVVERRVAPFRIGIVNINGSWIREFYGPTGYDFFKKYTVLLLVTMIGIHHILLTQMTIT